MKEENLVVRDQPIIGLGGAVLETWKRQRLAFLLN